jgi:hypothetical protein
MSSTSSQQERSDAFVYLVYSLEERCSFLEELVNELRNVVEELTSEVWNLLRKVVQCFFV